MNVIDKAKSALKQTVDSTKEQVASGGVKALLTKKNIIIAAVALVVVIGGFSLIFGGGGGGGSEPNLVGSWRTTDGTTTLEFSRNGTFELSHIERGIIEQGRWRTEYTVSENLLMISPWSLHYYDRYAPDSYFQPRDGSSWQFTLEGDRLSARRPGGSSTEIWIRVR